MEMLPQTKMWQLVLDQMVMDPKGKQGPQLICENIQHNHGVHISQWVACFLHFVSC